MRSRLRFIFAAAASLAGAMVLCGEPGSAQAAPPKPWFGSMRSIIEQTALVVEGDVTDISTTYDEAEGPRTVTELSNVKVHLGDGRVPNTIRLRSFGGLLPDGRRIDEAHVPTFAHGKHYLVFLRNGDWRLSPIAGQQAYLVERVAGRSIVLTGEGDSVLGISRSGAVHGIPVFLEHPESLEPEAQMTINPKISGEMVERALGVEQLVTAVRAFAGAEGIAVGGSFPEGPATDGPSWRVMFTSPGVTHKPAPVHSGVIMPDVSGEPAAERTVEELLACFEEPETLVDVSAEDLKVCMGGER